MRRCNYHNCCGCGVCASVCKFDAIKIDRDEHGFNVAKIDESKCTYCGACGLVCSTLKPVKSELPIYKFGLYTIDDNEALKSQSGGAFFWIAKLLLDKGYVIYGVVSNSPRDVRYTRCTELTSLDKLRGSKYVQPLLSRDIILKVKEDLVKGNTVLFSGLACHTQAILNYLDFYKIDTSNLFTLDLVCHGTPSMGMQEVYLDYIEDKEHSKIVSVNYRDKSYGWGTGYQTFKLESGKTIVGNVLSILFMHYGYTLNHTCFECRYTTPYRNTSITVSDFWGIEQHLGNDEVNYRKKGMSFVICRDKRIVDILNDNNGNGYRLISDSFVDNYLPYQLQHPTSKPEGYEKFQKQYLKNKRRTLLKYSLPLKRRIKRIITKSPLKMY